MIDPRARLYTVRAVAAACDVTERTVYRWRARGWLPVRARVEWDEILACQTKLGEGLAARAASGSAAASRNTRRTET